MGETIQNILGDLDRVNGYLWGQGTFFLLLGAGILFTVLTRFSQWRVLIHGYQVIRGRYDNPDDPGAINHFQALSAALSGTIGLGNIGGVALAVGLGGPGAVFWMWVVGFFGMAVKMVEITLAMMYRNTSDPDNPHGGAMWVAEKTLGAHGGARRALARVLGYFFSGSIMVYAIFGGSMFQAWNVAEVANTSFGLPKLWVGVVLAILVGMVVVGGIKRIGHVAGALVPFMCLLYMVSALAVLAVNLTALPDLFALIVRHAFTPLAPTGAFVGGSVMLAFSQGMRRALFSNEAGLGSAAIAHAAAKTSEPAREGIVGGLGPFIDTLVICTLSALVILITGTWNREPIGPMTGTVALTSADGQTVLSAPTSVEALPALTNGDTYVVDSAVFFIVEAPDADAPTGWRREKLQGMIVDGNGPVGTAIEWKTPPTGARWLTQDDGAPDQRIYRDYKGASMTAHAFDLAFDGLGKWLVTIASFLFALSTMITWYYYGEQCLWYGTNGKGIRVFQILFLGLSVLGATFIKTDAEIVVVADFATAWALWANMAIVLFLSLKAVRAINGYFDRLKAGEFEQNRSK